MAMGVRGFKKTMLGMEMLLGIMGLWVPGGRGGCCWGGRTQGDRLCWVGAGL